MSMMTQKIGVKSFSSAPQESSLKPDTTNRAGVGETGVPEGKDLGTHLNEIADPNWVDPAKTRRVGNNALDKDAFFKLMLAQIKHQDPTSPMKSDQMAAQLAQFTSLEQLQNMNTKLDELTKAQQPATQYQALNFIGKSIAGDTSKIVRLMGDTTHDLRFNILNDAQKAKVTIKNELGETVRVYEMNDVKKGENKIAWNGLDENSASTRAGEYYFEIEATGSRGEKIAALTSFKGQVTGVNYSSEGPILLVGNQSIRLRDVQRIEDSNLKADQSQNLNTNEKPALKTVGETQQNGIEGAKPPAKGNLDASIAMSQKVMDEKNNAKKELVK